MDMTGVPIHTRQEANTLGLDRYWTGKPCKNGHHDFRYTKIGACVGCLKSYRQKYGVKVRGLVTFGSRNVHPDDVPAIEAFIDALRMARNLAEPEAPPPPPPGPTDLQARLLSFLEDMGVNEISALTLNALAVKMSAPAPAVRYCLEDMKARGLIVAIPPNLTL